MFDDGLVSGEDCEKARRAYENCMAQIKSPQRDEWDAFCALHQREIDGDRG